MNHYFDYLKKLLFFCSPFIFLLLIYFFTDPFKVIYSYDDYYPKEDSVIYKNRDFVSTEMFIKNSKKYIYDSFIFGSSSALFFPPSIWNQYIKSSDFTFSFDASNEHISGIWSKIRFVHANGNTLKNALLVFDTGHTFGQFTNEDLIYMKHYKVYNTSRLKFQYKSLLSFINFKFLIALVHYKLSKNFYPYMKNYFEDRYYYFNLVTNELHFDGPRNELKRDSVAYYENHNDYFHTRDNKPVEIESQIDCSYIKMLEEIREIFLIENTNFKIVITPLYDQIYFNKDDLKILQGIFGENNIFDFSGINDYTNYVSNYYDNVHFKESVGSCILRDIYSSK